MKELNTILYVDDEPNIRTVATLALSSIGKFNVIVCASGQEALDKVMGTIPDLIILDVMMPYMDGPSTMAQLIQIPAIKDIPIVFMTAKVQPEEIAYFKSIGAIGVIAKPFDPMVLAKEVRQLWENYQSTHER